MNIKKLLLIVVLILFYSCGNNGDEHIGDWYADNGDEMVTISKGGKNGYVLNYHYNIMHNGRSLFRKHKGKFCVFKNDCFVDENEKSWFCMSGNKLINVDDGLTFKKQGK